MIKKLIIFILFLIISSGCFAAAVATPESNNYVTKRELAKIIAAEVGESPDKISEYLFTHDLDKNATMADVINILFESGLFDEQVKEEKQFLGKPTLKNYK